MTLPTPLVVEEIATAGRQEAQKATELRRAVVESILMQPQADGYGVRVMLKKTNPAALADGGVGDSQRSCGARI